MRILDALVGRSVYSCSNQAEELRHNLAVSEEHSVTLEPVGIASR